MKIAFLVTDFPKLTETFTLREAEELGKQGAEVRIFHLTKFRENEVVHEFSKPLVQSSLGRPYILGQGVFMGLLKFAAMNPVRFVRILTGLVSSYWRKPKLLAKSLIILPKCLRFSEDIRDWGATHVHATFAGHPGTAAWIIHRAGGPDYSLTCHAHDIFRTQLMLSTKFEEAKFVRTISDYNARFLRERVGEEACSNLQVIHCGLPAAEKQIKEPRDTPFTILFVGSLQLRKGAQCLLLALAKIAHQPDWTCNIAGDGPMADELKALAEKLCLLDRVQFLGPLDAKDVGKQYEMADVLVVPSIDGPNGRKEGIPTVIMEGFSASLPVIASRQTGIPELVKDGETGWLIEPGNIGQLSDSLLEVMNNPELSKQRAENGRNLVRRDFNLATNVKRLYSLIQELSVNNDGTHQT
ncbi:hypothetical protein A9Q94_18030 [Rhodobacterales bacterium 56_14_T64]|nr:hypothetical protein A9Q94_18030 [Rhodobacterales bacterium 56_14_T64]